MENTAEIIQKYKIDEADYQGTKETPKSKIKTKIHEYFRVNMETKVFNQLSNTLCVFVSV